GPASPVSPLKERAQAGRRQQQALEARLESCVQELRRLCLREAELTGTLPREYPLKAGEVPPKVRRRIGAAFKLDETLVLRGADPLSALERDLALQLQIAKAARRLCREENISKRLRKHRQTAALLEEQKLKDLENVLNQRRLLAGRRPLSSSPATAAAEERRGGGACSFPAGAPKPSQHPSSCPVWAGWELPAAQLGRAGPAGSATVPQRVGTGGVGAAEQRPPGTRWVAAAAVGEFWQPAASPAPLSPVRGTALTRAWHRSHPCLAPPSPVPCPTELSASDDSSLVEGCWQPGEPRGRSAVPRRRPTYYTVTVPTSCIPPTPGPTCRSGSDDSISDLSSISHATSPGSSSPDVSFLRPPPLTEPGYYPRGAPHRLLAPSGPPAFLYEQDLAPLRYQRLVPSHSRIVRTPSLKDYAPMGGRGLSKAAVTEELKSWHQRARLRGARPHSLDRQGAFRGPRGGVTRDVPITRGL
ncbi:INAVA protein, partial [Ramphastos sulfuratus]|nr:INAVA protein [Ramphastos sulfuratus]